MNDNVTRLRDVSGQGPVVYHVQVVRRPMFRMLQMVLDVSLFVGAAIVSHLIAASWLIELVLVVLVFVLLYPMGAFAKGKVGKMIIMTPEELKRYVDAGCPEEWQK